MHRGNYPSNSRHGQLPQNAVQYFMIKGHLCPLFLPRDICRTKKLMLYPQNFTNDTNNTIFTYLNMFDIEQHSFPLFSQIFENFFQFLFFVFCIFHFHFSLFFLSLFVCLSALFPSSYSFPPQCRQFRRSKFPELEEKDGCRSFFTKMMINLS